MEEGAPVHVAESPMKTEKVKGRGLTIPLRFKLLSIVILALGAAGAAYLVLDPALGILILITVTTTLVIFYLLAEYLFIVPIRKLLAWYRDARARAFKGIVAAPIDSSDEIGLLSRELNASISGFWGAEERVRTLSSHKNDTISLIEHQLRTPLTALRWSLESVAVPPQVRQALLRIEMNVRAIIEAARIEEGTFGFVFVGMDIAASIQKAAEEFKPFAESKGVQFDLVIEPNLPKIEADEDRIGIVLSNLISNAVDYTPSGGRVTVEARREQDGIMVTIADTGIGIPSDELPLLFNKLYRGRNAQRMQPDGSGLGMFIAKNIVHAHASDLIVRSAERQGTQVSFVLPLSQKGGA